MNKKYVIYHCECGCEYLSGNLKRTKLKGNIRYICPKHNKPIAFRVTTCQNPQCSCTFEISTRGQIPSYCIKCRKDKGIKIYKGKDCIVAGLQLSASIEAIINRPECVHHNKCLSEAAFKNEEKLPCDKCKQYVSIEREYSPTIKSEMNLTYR